MPPKAGEGIDGKLASLLYAETQGSLVTNDSDAPRLHKDDLAAIGKEAAKLLAETLIVPHPSPPSGAMTGADLRSIQQFDPDISALERYVTMMVASKLSSFMTREQIIDLLQSRTSPFLSREQIQAVIHEEMEDDATLRAAKYVIRGVAACVDFAGGVGKKVLGALAIFGIWALLRWLGLKDLPSPPGLGE